MDSSDLQQRCKRRDAFKIAAGVAVVGTTLISGIRPAEGQSASDIDALNFMLNIEYLIAQFASAASGELVPLDRLTGSGAAGVTPLGGRAVTFSDAQLRAIVREIASDARGHLLPMRSVIGAPAVRQPLMDISAGATAPFTTAMRRAGVVAAGVTFDPYASEENLLYCLFFLKNISTLAYRSLAPTLSNRVVVRNFSGLLGAESVHTAVIRSYLYTRGAAVPSLRTNADSIAALQRTLNGADAFQGVSSSRREYPGGQAAVDTANATSIMQNGQMPTRSAAQILNQLYLTNAAATSGGFFPEGVNGAIRTSAAA